MGKERATRIVKVTLGLAAAGAVAGAAAGFLFTCAVAATVGLYSVSQGVDVLLFGTLAGGALGTVLGPAAAWLLMRHVPLGLAIGATALGALAGALAGWFLLPASLLTLLGPFAGFGAAVAWLRLRVPADPAERQVRAVDGS